MSPAITSRLATAGRLALVILACMLVGPQLAAARTHGCAHANTPSSPSRRAEIRRAVVCLINRQRTSRGLPALHVDGRLNRSAQHWTYKMVREDRFTHGSNFAARISAVGFDWSIAGENIASGYQTPWQVVSGWMASAGHCENILSPDFSRVGTGVLDHGVDGTGAATWTQDFALPMGARMPSHRTGPANGCPYRI